jgi:Ca2+-binding EF-hand superfamily protein
MKGIKELGISEIKSKDLEMLFKRYDDDLDGTLRFSEFSHMFDPISEEHS